MEAVARGAITYVFLLLVFRISGKRTLSQATPFDVVLLLIISEATQQAMLGEDYSLTYAFILIATLVGADVLLSILLQRVPRLKRFAEGLPLVLVKDGEPLRDRLARCRVDEDDILVAARERQGLASMDQIQFAILEESGAISIIPKTAK